jgi:hypothetical protein
LAGTVERTHHLRDRARRLESRMRQGLMLAGKVVQQAGQLKAPELTGQMTRSVTVSEPRYVGGVLTVYVGPGPESAAYAKYSELPRYIAMRPGLGPISRRKGATKPWLKPALDAHRQEVVDILRSSLRQGLQDIARS